MNDHPALMMAGQKGESMKTSKKEYCEMIRNAFECSREYFIRVNTKTPISSWGLQEESLSLWILRKQLHKRNLISF